MTAQLAPPPVFRSWDNLGLPLVGGKLNTYVAGTTTRQATYVDSTQTTPNTNPVILNFRGEALVWLDPSLTYKFVLTDALGNLIWTEDNIPGGFGALPISVSLIPNPTNTFTLGNSTHSWANVYLGPIAAPAYDTISGNVAYYAKTPAEAAVGVTIVSFGMPPGELYRYGTNATPGTTDMTAAVNAWLSVGGNLTMSVSDTVLVSGVLNMVSNTTLALAEGATFKTSTPNLSVFKALSKTNIQIRGGTILQTANGVSVHIGMIELNGCADCSVEGVEIIGAQWGGVLLSGSSNCTVRACYIHNSLGVTIPNVDSHDISCYGACQANVIEGNICSGSVTVEHGIMVQDPGSSLIPLRNTVYGNRVGPHSSYGILSYNIDSANTYTTIENNYIEGITGTSQGGSSGMGIYIQNTGGVVCCNNTIRNCCISSSNESLTPAGIGVNNINAPLVPPTLSGNTILDIQNYSGINISSSSSGATITGNTIHFSAGNTAFKGIYVNVSSNVAVTGNNIFIDTSIANGHGIFVFANGVSFSNISISDNVITGCSLRGIRVDTTGAPTTTNVTINGNNVSGGGSASVPIQIGNIILGVVSGNLASATTVNAFNLNACTQTRISGNSFTTTGSAAISMSGTNTNSYYDKTNWQNTAVDNVGVGMICEQLGSASPASSSFHAQIGDRVEQSVPVVGNPKGWRCTVAGNPGTWVSEGNL